MKIRVRVCYIILLNYFSHAKNAFECVSSYTRDRQPNFLENIILLTLIRETQWGTWRHKPVRSRNRLFALCLPHESSESDILYFRGDFSLTEIEISFNMKKSLFWTPFKKDIFDTLNNSAFFPPRWFATSLETLYFWILLPSPYLISSKIRITYPRETKYRKNNNRQME